jgi:hypothetical protein
MTSKKIVEYIQRLKIEVDGDEEEILHTKDHMIIAKGYERVVIGDRGPYIELANRHILLDGIFIPREQHWRFEPKWRKKVVYFEFRTVDNSHLKIYLQNRRVDHTDFREEFWYVSPFGIKIREDKGLVEAILPKNKGGN